MELKKYQKRVIADLQDYLHHLTESGSLEAAFRAHWGARGISVGNHGVLGYQNVIDGVPQVCYKVPTGGGKTLLACASLRSIVNALPPTRHDAVVWLVPSEAILTQTLAALKDRTHPYRQRLDADFAGRVEVYSKDEVMAGQNFSPVTVAEQLSVMVLSYDSFRARSKEGRKAYQANGNLAPFGTAFGIPEYPIAGADRTSLFQVINQLNPIVIVDESHHATTTLSQEMLVDFNPSFILDLTATPKKQANVISYVDAFELKSEHMVKLPVIAYNRSSQSDVITDAIDLRQSLEAAADAQLQRGGRYIRPIVLFQAQPKTGEDATSFERLREKLVTAGIPEKQIAIKTAQINELQNVDLLSQDCEIRFIITVNALKEGWDCSFAYILASLANKTSQVDVEQVLGRVLRQPHAQHFREPILNMSYVLTSSADFNGTLGKIIEGLNAAGFSKHDVRATDEPIIDVASVEPSTGDNDVMTPPLADSASTESPEEFLDFSEETVAERLAERAASPDTAASPAAEVSALTPMIAEAEKRGSAYEQEAEAAVRDGGVIVPKEMEAAVVTSRMFSQYVDDYAGFMLPQFVIQTPDSPLFTANEMNDGREVLHHRALASGFTLRGKDTRIDLTADEQMFRIDVPSAKDTPRAFRMNPVDQRIMREHFRGLSLEGQKRSAAQDIVGKLKPIDEIRESDLQDYVKRVVETFDSSSIQVYLERPQRIADQIRFKIDGFLKTYKAERFADDTETGRITVDFSYGLPETIQTIDATSLIGGSLYESEDHMNKDETEFASRFSSMDNIRWWHRNIERRGFCINGPLNHYPDFILMTARGTLVAVEPKGAHLKNDSSKVKLALGQKWASMAGGKFRYYMVFQDGVTPLEGAHTSSKFLELLARL